MSELELLNNYEVLKDYFVDKPKPIFDSKTIQIILLREVLDFTIFRTEESKELNTVITPTAIDNDDPVERVAFLGSKQKAVESRQLASLLRTATNDVEYDEVEECYLKDYLCLKCPRCGLFGGTSASSSNKSDSNIKHRIAYSTAYSLDSFEELQELITFNGINDKKVNTGQALGVRKSVKPASIFPSIITLRSVTWKEFIWVVKSLLSAHKYGAESRIGGNVRNNIVGIAAGWEEVITPLELTLELSKEENKVDIDNISNILEEYKGIAAHTNKIKILNSEKLGNILEETQEFELDKDFIEESYKDIEAYRKEQGE
ncbi:type I-D CRISPR-associated protein Cas7/Csc2 [Fuchsiella alkaliacetigena]|uniref:type I-D CRISPR-associated protein Cas7/Csc2 n=1 Tax=Fuchsiella alkaliacetigena TaxID=957042 RepID=UPI00200A9F38|nr:type I-D CRISPR-associated protein Cas7/Csc2 [Fuchsiella alkaliacetigena]MCK8825369.1 type I-D CRISPR-associated protein Cas7/Csc2 [Fuchsiella alkaliacetigena]